MSALSEEKKNLIRDVTKRLDLLPPNKQENIIWYMKGVIDTEESHSRKVQKENS